MFISQFLLQCSPWRINLLIRYPHRPNGFSNVPRQRSYQNGSWFEVVFNSSQEKRLGIPSFVKILPFILPLQTLPPSTIKPSSMKQLDKILSL